MASASPQYRDHKRLPIGRYLIYLFITLTAIAWIVPIAGAIFASFRPFTDTVQNGFFS